MKRRVGVLALQGCVQPHWAHIEAAGAEFVEVRDAQTLSRVDGLILPGGESTAMLKLLDYFEMKTALREAFRRIPCWGICAGAILMARSIQGRDQFSFGALDIEVQRNAYGRQQESFFAEIKQYSVAFIRAPKILATGPGVETLATHESDPVWVRQSSSMATTFHPELSEQKPSPMHRFFVEIIRSTEINPRSFLLL